MEQTTATFKLPKHELLVIQVVEEEINPQPKLLINLESPTVRIAQCFARELIEQLNQQHRSNGSHP